MFISLEKFFLPKGVHFFLTTRQIGESTAQFAGQKGAEGGQAYANFNLASHVGDDPQRVLANRSRLMAHLGLPLDRLCMVQQVHGAHTLVVQEPLSATYQADAMVTNMPGLVLGVVVADCVPVLLADPVARVIGAVHAGWRGALAGVVESCLTAMLALGAETDRIHALIGPAIRQAQYEVGPEVFACFKQSKEFTESVENFFIPKQKLLGEKKYFFNLAGLVNWRLKFFGLHTIHIQDVELCTFLHEDQFFSHRRSTWQGQGNCGRQMGGIFLD
ncbi:MAG: peptidoglycan editing factor PgeF [Magnetococcus sp. DMHC-6]